MFPPELEAIEKSANIKLANLRAAEERSKKKSDELRDSIKEEFDALSKKGVQLDDIELLIMGSIARKEVTEGSDCDYLLVSAATPPHESIVASLNAVERVVVKDLKLVEPGSQGVFGEFITAAELFIRVGLERDSNLNMTRRMSILLESESFRVSGIRDMVIARIVERYCAKYSPTYGREKEDPVRVPRFLVNDLMRYWRTIAVDFEAKRWTSPKDGWGLRYTKLLSTRKIMFAGSLASYLTAGKHLDALNLDTVDARYKQLMEYVISESNKPPIARLAAIYSFLDEGVKEKLVQCIICYDKVIQILNQPSAKTALKAGESGEMKDIMKLTSGLNLLLEDVFFEDSFMSPLTKGYTLF